MEACWEEDRIFNEKSFPFPLLLYYGRTADAVTDGCTDKDELDIHQHAVSGNAVFSKQAQELDVVEHGHERRGDVAHEFG